MPAFALGRDRLAWLVGLSLLSLGSNALQAVLGLQVGATVSIGGSPAGMIALLLGLALELLLWFLAMKLAVEAMLRAAQGLDAGTECVVADGLALRHLLLWAAIGALAFLAWHIPEARHRHRIGTSFIGLALFLLPALLTLLTMEGSLRRTLDPRAWRDLAERAGASYLHPVSTVVLLVASAVAATLVFGKLLPAWFAIAPIRFVQWLALLLAYERIGLWVHGHRRRFLIEEAPRLARPQLGSFDEDEAMGEAEALAAEDPAAAAARLVPILRGRGGSAPLRARYRELLQAAGDLEGLLAHDREYIAVLLALGQERQALALYLSARALAADFELQEPEEIARLAEFTERTGQHRLAAALALEHARRFPRTREAPAQALRAVRLHTAHPGHDGELRAALQAVLDRHPEHALQADLQRALHTLPEG